MPDIKKHIYISGTHDFDIMYLNKKYYIKESELFLKEVIKNFDVKFVDTKKFMAFKNDIDMGIQHCTTYALYILETPNIFSESDSQQEIIINELETKFLKNYITQGIHILKEKSKDCDIYIYNVIMERGGSGDENWYTTIFRLLITCAFVK